VSYTIDNFLNFSLITEEKAVLWYAWHGNIVVGEAFIVVGLHEENQHLLMCDVQVLASYRRRGLGKALLSKVVEVANTENRRLIMAETDANIPAGEVFAKRIGARRGLAQHISQLNLDTLDHVLLNHWKEAAPKDDFSLLFWHGAYPDDKLEAMAKLHEVMNTAPKDDLEYEDERVTPKDLRETEAYDTARGFERWTLVAQDTTSSNLAGFTEVAWHPDNPQTLLQRDTAVDPSYRNRGLGRWLKAEMLEWFREHRPQVVRVRTDNADSNAVMLAINRALGFKPYKATTEWQVEVTQVKEYLLESTPSNIKLSTF